MQINIYVYCSKLWLAIDLIISKLVPSIFVTYSSVLRNPPNVVDGLKKQLIPAIIAFLANSVSRSLASVQRISFPLYLRVLDHEQNREYDVSETEKCVDCLVLSEPIDKEIEADVIFIHGLHGSITKTWKQGTWRNERHKLNRQLPVRRISSGNLYVPARQQSLKRTLSEIYSKIPNKTARRKKGTCDASNDFKYNSENSTEEQENYSPCWPRDWIHKDCPNVRVIAVNYSTDVLWSPVWAKKRLR